MLSINLKLRARFGINQNLYSKSILSFFFDIKTNYPLISLSKTSIFPVIRFNRYSLCFFFVFMSVLRQMEYLLYDKKILFDGNTNLKML